MGVLGRDADGFSRHFRLYLFSCFIKGQKVQTISIPAFHSEEGETNLKEREVEIIPRYSHHTKHKQKVLNLKYGRKVMDQGMRPGNKNSLE